MSEEIKPGAPVNPNLGEWYVLRFTEGEVIARWTGYWFESVGNQAFYPKNVLAHRRHIPLTLPPLKPLHRCEGVPCVVRYNCAVLRAMRYSGHYRFDMAGHAVPQCIGPNGVVELTRAECEQAGYEWPEGAVEP